MKTSPSEVSNMALLSNKGTTRVSKNELICIKWTTCVQSSKHPWCMVQFKDVSIIFPHELPFCRLTSPQALPYYWLLLATTPRPHRYHTCRCQRRFLGSATGTGGTGTWRWMKTCNLGGFYPPWIFETNSSHLEICWKMNFFLGPGLFSGAFAVSFREGFKLQAHVKKKPTKLRFLIWWSGRWNSIFKKTWW